MNLDEQEYKHVFGDQTKTQLTHSGEADERDWLILNPVCEVLKQFQIHHLGKIIAHQPYSVIRQEQKSSFFLSTASGSGEVLVNGKWVTCEKNQAVVLPPNRLNAMRAHTSSPWEFHYVRYVKRDGHTPLIRTIDPIIADFSNDTFSHMVNGLLTEIYSHNRAKYTWQWLQLIQLSISDFCEPWSVDDRLWDIWTKIGQSLQTAWSLDKIAKKAGLSGEHLRRLTIQTYGRSPMKQVSWLRMQRAAELLISTEDKIESIGMQCGYKNVNTFTSTFKKNFMQTPSDYRRQLV